MTGASRARPGDRPCIPYVNQCRLHKTKKHTVHSSLESFTALVTKLQPGPGAPLRAARVYDVTDERHMGAA